MIHGRMRVTPSLTVLNPSPPSSPPPLSSPALTSKEEGEGVASLMPGSVTGKEAPIEFSVSPLSSVSPIPSCPDLLSPQLCDTDDAGGASHVHDLGERGGTTLECTQNQTASEQGQLRRHITRAEVKTDLEEIQSIIHRQTK